VFGAGETVSGLSSDGMWCGAGDVESRAHSYTSFSTDVALGSVLIFKKVLRRGTRADGTTGLVDAASCSTSSITASRAEGGAAETTAAMRLSRVGNLY
jgi:hypothetical protein